jgi:hypothetical protein
MKKFISKWNFPRILRLLVGIFILYDGIMSSEYLFVILGFAFSLMALLDYGCCGTTQCNSNINTSEKQIEDKEIIFEEVK